MLLLCAVPALFFAGARRFRPAPPRVAAGLRVVAVVPLFASGMLHLARPEVFVPLLPPPVPPAAWIIVATGIPELLGAVGLLLPRWRRAASVNLALLMSAIFPANIHVAGRAVAGLPMPGVPARAAMQAAYMALLLVAGWGLPARSER